MKLTSKSRVLDLMRIAGVLRVSCLFAAISLSCSVLAVAQTAPSQVSPGTISGKVTLSGKPVGGIKVILMSEGSGGPQSGSVAARAKTDDAGLYNFGELSPGHYLVIPLTPADVLQGDTMSFQEGKSVLLDSGEQASGVDLNLQPGAVISGRVVDAASQPISGQHVMMEKLDESGKAVGYWGIRPFNITTDDRGIYRAYGIPAGRYKVSVGGDQSSVSGPVHFAKTYSPGVTDPATANIVEVQAGAESLNVDISLAAGSKTYSVSGRFVESDTGLALPYLGYAYGRQPGGYVGSSGTTTDAKGQFKLQGLAPGHYQVMVSQDDPTGYVAESNEFDVTDSDVSGLEVKATRGSSVSGTITLENSNADPSVAAGISGLTIFAVTVPPQGGMVTFKMISPAADGTFQLTGLTAGSLRLQLRNGSADPSGYRLARVELNGAVSPPKGIDVGPGQQVTGVNVVVAYGTGTIRGTVNVAGPPLPDGARLFVSARKTGGAANAQPYAAGIDAVGHFQIDSVSDGDYELILQGFVPQRGQPLLFKYTRPTVSLVGGQTVNVNIDAEYQTQPAKQ